MSHFKKRLAVFRIPAFRWLVLSCLLATLGTGLNYIAMSWILVTARNSVSSIAISMLCFWLPGVVLGPWVGALVDRHSRKWIIIITNSVRAIILCVFAWVLTIHMSVMGVYLLALLTGILFSPLLPAMSVLVREMIPQQDLLYANASIDMAYEVGNVVGMGCAGLLIALFSAPMAFLINGILFVISALALIMVKSKDLIYPTVQTTDQRGLWRDFTASLHYLKGKKLLIVFSILQVIFITEYMTAPVMLAPFAKDVLHASVGQFGVIETMLSVGVIVGGILVPWLSDRLGFFKAISIVTVIMMVSLALFGYDRSIAIADVLYFFVGIGFGAWPVIITRAQHLTDIAYQGRVQSTFNSLSGVLIIVVYSLVSFASDYVSLGALFWMQVALSGAALMLLWWHRE